MSLKTRSDKSRTLAAISALGLFASFCIYCASFSGHLVDDLFPLFAVFLVGALVLVLPMYAREYPALKGLSFFRQFAHRMPRWIPQCEFVLVINAIVHIIWFAAHSGSGVPDIVNGQYVIDDHGHILKVLTQADYFALRGAALRMCMAVIAVLYFLPSTYWWFVGRKEE